MKKLTITDSPHITPMMLESTAGVWVKLHSATTAQGMGTQALLPGIYALLTALELRMKAYIILKDKTYALPTKVQALGHSFDKIFKALKPLIPNTEAKLIEAALRQYNLFELNINDLKYPLSPRGWAIPDDLLAGTHGLQDIFDLIQQSILADGRAWYDDFKGSSSQVLPFEQ